MTTRRLINDLQQRPGMSGVRHWHVRHAIVAGKIPAPPLDESLRFDWSPEHVDLLASVLRPGKRGS